MSEIIKVASVNPKEIATLAIEYKKKLRTLERELNKYLLKYGFEISYHYELSVIKISNKDEIRIQSLINQKPILVFPAIETRQERKLCDVFILENGAILLRITTIKRRKIKEQYYVLTRKGLKQII
ncbi:MAG: hypothetical protein DRN04_18865 [Thermoprotei archaeon]|nr:MAG: hypothetical protein DRN04_18865 [Thermoprotei archaeon]